MLCRRSSPEKYVAKTTRLDAYTARPRRVQISEVQLPISDTVPKMTIWNARRNDSVKSEQMFFSIAIVLYVAAMAGCSAEVAVPAARVMPTGSVAEEPSSDALAEMPLADFYSVGSYDKAADPNEHLTKTLKQAKAEDKRVILQVGGDWCHWCGLISEFMTTNETVRDHLDENFLVMKVTYPGDFSEAFLAKYPECDAYPHFFVLDSEGELLHSQGTGELEKGEGYDQEIFMAFLEKWTS